MIRSQKCKRILNLLQKKNKNHVGRKYLQNVLIDYDFKVILTFPYFIK